ncbi:hypothetical protein [Vibrio parahaemolyticus]|uniref:hypothetical protein n=1 Tax=Vibrio parahaemolyticus TaxID=670 RepID=UPI00100F6ADA|nr:hypothetical protein [Vibrio parahaemolyticus]MCS0092039.1 hypothetical protein [Vibrio parahaemolyticus]RXP52244.1 hypothetical protein EGL73_26060 [Vibrio parahaemolyticus]RXP52414.1 hypothetical protein EGL72_26290 [Vibrio parahaemolyticus]RXP65130.1 hypothetical protein EGL71_26205 [Vibrio parahaemolyticus]RXP65172.1 hypothetical protein EGL70_25960 [Vibrio parahaemolyticus]
MLNHDDRLPSVVIGLSFSNVISGSNQQQPTTAPETTANHGAGIILEPEKPTAHWITARIWYELGLRVGLVE